MPKICYYGDKLSPNMAKTPEGFLVCQNVPIARTGYQKYYAQELDENADPNVVVNVYRSPDEVFSPATLASFEGKPVTNEHPSEDVTPENYAKYSKGHVQHVRVGKGDDSDKIMADLYITDPELMQLIQDGKRDVSAGYYAEDKEDKNGRICQTHIRGNHIAVVDEGRAGRSVSIRDSKNRKKGDVSMSRKQRVKSIIARYIKDATPEELDELISDSKEARDALCDEDIVKDDDEIVENEDIVEDDDETIEDDDEIDVGSIDDEILEAFERLKEAVARCTSRRTAAVEKDDLLEDDDDTLLEDEDDIVEDEDAPLLDDEDIVEDEDDLTEDEDVIESDDEIIEDDEDIDVIPTDEVEGRLAKNDSMLKRISRAVLTIRDPRDRRRVQNEIIRATSKRDSQMPGLMQLTKKMQGARRDGVNAKTINVETQQKAYDALNPHKNTTK